VARPEAFGLQGILTADSKPLRIPLHTAVSALRPTTSTQRAVLALVRQQARRFLDDATG